MAGPSLSHIFAPPRPAAYATGIAATPELAATAISGAIPVPVASTRSGPAAEPSSLSSQAHVVPTLLIARLSSSASPPGHAQQYTSTAAGKSHGRKKIYACSDCGRPYSRPEHLVRHVQTHTLGRRFICEICQKSFTRKDVLRRHITNHENDKPQKRLRTVSLPSAGRVSQACRPCAVARAKCDEVKPCRRCVKRKLTCVASDSGPAAAMHGVHLSASAHTATLESPPYPYAASGSGDSLDSSSPASHGQVRYVPSGSLSSQDTATTKSTPLSQSKFHRPEDSQLSPPDTTPDLGNVDTFRQSYEAPRTLPNAIPDINTTPILKFLRDILYEQPFDPSRLPDSQGLAVLENCDNANLELTNIDFSLLDNWNWNWNGMVEGMLPV